MIKTYRFNKQSGLEILEEPLKSTQDDTFVWTDIENPDEQETRVLAEYYKFHPLAIEDCINTRQRPKIDDYRDYFFIVLHPVSEATAAQKVRVSEIGVFVGRNYIVTFHQDPVRSVTSVWESIEKKPELILRGIDYVLYLITDAVVDEYFPILDNIDERFSGIEARLLDKPAASDLNDLFKLKRILVDLRKILSPHRELVNTLIRYEGVFIRDDNRVFYIDVYDHLMRIFDFLDTYRDLISSSQEIYLTVVSNRMNEVMKTLTVIATITLPLTLISSIYGMNFRHIPELEWRYGYFWALGLMLTTAGALVYYFRKKDWF